MWNGAAEVVLLHLEGMQLLQLPVSNRDAASEPVLAQPHILDVCREVRQRSSQPVALQPKHLEVARSRKGGKLPGQLLYGWKVSQHHFWYANFRI